MGADVARILTFFNADNEKDGTWETFFAVDEAVLMAMMVSMDLKRIELGYTVLFSRGEPLSLAEQSYRLAQSIDFWFTGLAAIDEPVAHGLAQRIGGVIQKKLIDDLHSLGSFFGRYDNLVSRKYGIDLRSFHRIWKIEEDREKRLVFPQSYSVPSENREAVKEFLKSNFYAFFDSIFYLKGTVATHLADSLETGTHSPAPGLYIAFVKLFQKVKENLHRFTDQHRHFYYNKDGGDLSAVIGEIAKVIGTTPADAFQKVFGTIFHIELTTESGWLQVPEYVITHRMIDTTCPRDWLQIQFRLRPDVAPIIAYSPAVHDGWFDTDLPMLRLVINPDAYLYPYSLLKDLLIRKIEIHADVQKVKDVLVYNNLGQHDPNTPFHPFGPIPWVGSYVPSGARPSGTRRDKQARPRLYARC